MLRITLQDRPGVLTYRLEGRLAGPNVRVLAECWQTTRARPHPPVLRVDLTEVTSVDAAGQACLAAMHGQGAEFITADCQMEAVVAEITQGPGHDGAGGPAKRRMRSETSEGGTQP